MHRTLISPGGAVKVVIVRGEEELTLHDANIQVTEVAPGAIELLFPFKLEGDFSGAERIIIEAYDQTYGGDVTWRDAGMLLISTSG